MHQEVFKTGVFKAIILPILMTLALLYYYYYLITLPYYTPPFPFWTLLFLFIPIIVAVEGQSKKLIVEGDILRYKRVFPIRRDDQVSLHDVHGFKVDFVRDASDDSSTKVIHIIDKKGNQLFTIPGSLLGRGNRNRFKAAVLAVNPDIKIF